MREETFLKEIQQGKIFPAYLFEGKEDYLKRKALKKLRDKLVSSQYIDFNYEAFSGTGVSGKQVVESAYLLPFKDRWRMVVVTEIDKLKTVDQKIIISYLNNPVDSTCLVGIGEKFNRKGGLYQSFYRKGKVVSFYLLKGKYLIQWINQQVEQEGRKITPEAAVQLYNRMGENLCRLKNEIEKLILFSYPAKIIRKDDVAKVTGEEKGKGIFDLATAFRKGELSLSLKILSYLLEKGSDPLKIHALLAKEVRVILRIKLEGRKASLQKICSFIFYPQSYYSEFYTRIAQEYIQAAERFSIPKLTEAYEDLLKTELYLKRGEEEPEIALPRLILNILT